jgi:recombination protein RecT
MTELATRNDDKPTIGQLITRMQPEIARALPKGMDADRIARLALTVVRQTPALERCTPASFAGALLTAAALGLEPGVNGEAYLVPYKGECTLIVGYQGYAKLFWQHPLAKHLDAHAVHANDTFEYAYGLAQYLRHTPADGDRGEITHYWAAASLSTGASSFVVLTAAETRKLRGGKVGTSGGIADPMHWMERKTALRQLFKLLPKSTTLSAALAVDEQRGSVLVERAVPQAIESGDGVGELGPSVTAEAVAEQDARDQAQAAGLVSVDELTGEVGPELDENGWPPVVKPGTGGKR